MQIVCGFGQKALFSRRYSIAIQRMQLSIQTGLPTVPIVVRGAHALWQNKTFIVTSGEFTVEALPAIDTNDWTEENLEAHIASIEAVHREALNQ